MKAQGIRGDKKHIQAIHGERSTALVCVQTDRVQRNWLSRIPAHRPPETTVQETQMWTPHINSCSNSIPITSLRNLIYGSVSTFHCPDTLRLGILSNTYDTCPPRPNNDPPHHPRNDHYGKRGIE